MQGLHKTLSSLKNRLLMRLLSVNVGLPREVSWQGRVVSTAIFKDPVAGSVRVGRLNLEGDRQADLTVHGGPTKAIYAYPSEHYEFWREQLTGTVLEWGAFGENFTTEGLGESSISIGDRYRIGAARLVVTEPRMPCFKLGIRFGDPGMIKRFLQSERSGFYFGVEEEGRVEAGDPIELLEKNPGSDLRVREVTRLYTSDRENRELLRKAVETEALPETWRGYFARRLEKLSRV